MARGWPCCWGPWGWPGGAPGPCPGPLTTAALASAGVDALAPVVLAVPKAALVVPAGRFPTFIVLGISGARLARGHRNWLGAQTVDNQHG
jgi:hypothetical protein